MANTIAKRTGTLADSDAGKTPALSLSLTGAELYRYDGFDRMTDVQTRSGSSIYTYRPDGLRLSKTVNGVTTSQVWEGNQIALELDGNGTVTDRYIRGIGLLKSDDNGWYLFNTHGDVVQFADSTGAVTKTYAYDAFGNEKSIAAIDTNPFRYSGEYYDKETGRSLAYWQLNCTNLFCCLVPGNNPARLLPDTPLMKARKTKIKFLKLQ